jgi:hypothetical protein
VEPKIPTKIAPEEMLIKINMKVNKTRLVGERSRKSPRAVVGIHSPTGTIDITMARTELSRRPKADKGLILLTATAKE